MSAAAHIRQAVDAAREARGVSGTAPDEPLRDVLGVVEDHLGLDVIVALLGAGVAGAYLRRGARALALVAGEDVPVRRRFTLAHELGHHRLGHASHVDDERSLRDRVHPVEAAANRFAAEFLAPPEAVARVIAELPDHDPTLELVVRVAHRFGLSAQAARIRLETIGFLTEPGRIARLDREIVGERLHRDVARSLGLGEPDDALARLGEADLPRLPASAAGSVLAERLAGVLDGHEAERALGVADGALERALGR